MNKNLKMIAAVAAISTLASAMPVLTVHADSTTIDNTTTTDSSTTTGAAVTVTTGSAVTTNNDNNTTTTGAAVTTGPAVTTNQTPKDLGDAITAYFSSFTASNGLTEDMLKSYCSDLRTNYSLYVTIENCKIENATWSSNGSIVCTVLITDGNDGTTYSMPLSLIINKLPFASDTALMSQVTTAISGVTFTDLTTQDSIISLIKSAINDPSINVGISDFTLVGANYTATGTVKGKITLTNSSNETLTMSLARPVYLTTEEQLDYNNLVKETQSILTSVNNLNFTSSPTQENIQNYINTLLAGTNYTANIVEFDVTEATGNNMGNLSLTLKLTDTTTGHQMALTNNINIYIQATYNIKTKVESAMSKITYTKDTTEKEILSDVKTALNDSNLNIDIYNFYFKYDESTNTLSCYYTIRVEDEYGNDIIESTTSTTKIGTTGSTATTNSSSSSSSNGSSSSSSSGSSSSSSSSSSNSSTTGTTATSTNSNDTVAKVQSMFAGNGTTPITKDTIAAVISTIGLNKVEDPAAAKEIAKEVAKVVTENIVSDLSTTVGQGVTASDAKQVTTTDGNTVSVSTLTKDGTNLGAVITADKDSAIATIPVDTTSGNITAVYKFVPLLGKYIQLTDGVQITSNAVTLPTQANATYVAVANQLASADTVSQGWAKVNNNWYMVNANGDPQIGWQKDSTGWTYMSPTNGVMQTGWKLDGGNWYYLQGNGYMSTGWVKDGESWYYMNQDGSMASNTVIDGYTLGSNGALV